MTDWIRLEGMVFYGFHGLNQEERALGQRFLVDLEVALDLGVAGRSDSLADTVNYAALFRTVRGVVEGPPKNLIEAVAEEIAQRILDSFPVAEVIVQVHKPGVAIKGSILESASVEIQREREG